MCIQSLEGFDWGCKSDCALLSLVDDVTRRSPSTPADCRQVVGSPTLGPTSFQLPSIFCDQDNLTVVGEPLHTPQVS